MVALMALYVAPVALRRLVPYLIDDVPELLADLTRAMRLVGVLAC